MTATLWEDEGSLDFLVGAKDIPVNDFENENMISPETDALNAIEELPESSETVQRTFDERDLFRASREQAANANESPTEARQDHIDDDVGSSNQNRSGAASDSTVDHIWEDRGDALMPFILEELNKLPESARNTELNESISDAESDDSEGILPPLAWQKKRTKGKASMAFRYGMEIFAAIGAIEKLVSDMRSLLGTTDSAPLGKVKLVELLHSLWGASVELRCQDNDAALATTIKRIRDNLAEFPNALRKGLAELDRWATEVPLDVRKAALEQLQEDFNIVMHSFNICVAHGGGDPFNMEPWGVWDAYQSEVDTTGANEVDHQDSGLVAMGQDDGSDRASVISQMESIFLVASLHSVATGLSAAGGYSAAQIESATRELLHVFLEDQALVSLYTVAVERVNIGPARLQRNIGRLLKAFAHDLRSEAEQELEKLAARLVSTKASYVAQAIIERYEVRPPSEFALHSQSLFEDHQKEDSSDGEEEPTDGGRSEEPVDEDLIEDLHAFRRFLAAGEALAKFRRQLEAFVLPRSTELKTESVVKEPSPNQVTASSPELEFSMCTADGPSGLKVQPSTFSKIRKAAAHLFSAAGLLEPHLDCGWVRLRWQCVS